MPDRLTAVQYSRPHNWLSSLMHKFLTMGTSSMSHPLQSILKYHCPMAPLSAMLFSQPRALRASTPAASPHLSLHAYSNVNTQPFQTCANNGNCKVHFRS